MPGPHIETLYIECQLPIHSSFHKNPDFTANDCYRQFTQIFTFTYLFLHPEISILSGRTPITVAAQNGKNYCIRILNPSNAQAVEYMHLAIEMAKIYAFLKKITTKKLNKNLT